MRLGHISMKNFAPFADGKIHFPVVENHPDLAEVHLFTGENGTGKTRVLAALMASLGNLNELQDRVRQDSGTELVVDAWINWCEAEAPHTKGELDWAYFNGGQSPRTAHFAEQIMDGYAEMKAAAEDAGTTPFPPPVGEGWAMAGTGAALLDDSKLAPGASIPQASALETLSLSRPAGGSSMFQRLMNLRLGVALERDRSGGSTRRLSTSLEELEKTISRITGREFALQIRQGRENRLEFHWGGAELFFGELPDGLRSLLNWLAGWVVLQVEHFENSPAPLREPVILILDEPENHMHPAWQRRVLPEVQRLFPCAQMFVVTHSPFVVCSLNHGWIHRFLRKRADDKVRVEDPKPAQEGDTYADAVEDVLGLKAIERFDPESEKLLDEFQSLLRKAGRGKATRSEVEKQAADLTRRGGEVASIVEAEMYQLSAAGEA